MVDVDLTRSVMDELERQYREALILLVEPIAAELDRISRHAYKDRRRSDGYWHMERARLLRFSFGYDEATFHECRGKPPPGVIWIEPSHGTSKNDCRSRKTRKGRPLTFDEILERLAARGTPYVPGQ
jgi:hypothetical protein